MATIKLGAFISEIAGSVGGTNFRRFRGQTVVSNKTSGASKSKLLQNKGLMNTVKVNKTWSGLSASVKNVWATQANNFNFKDKFGNDKKLTAYQFYCYISNNAVNSGQSIPDPATIVSAVEVLDIGIIDFFGYNDQVDVTLNTSISNIKVLFYFEITTGALPAPTFTRRRLAGVNTITEGISVTYLELAGALDPNSYKVGDNVRIYLQTVNTSGFKSVMQYVEGVVSA